MTADLSQDRVTQRHLLSTFPLKSKSETERGSCRINIQGSSFGDVPLVEFMYFACQVRVTVGDSGLCCCTCVTYFDANYLPCVLTLKPKLHEALQSLVVTTCGQPCLGFAGCSPRDDPTRCSPLAWRSADRKSTPSYPKSLASILLRR